MTTAHPLQGKVAFVQGGSRGIGAAIVKRLASEGAAVAFTYAASADRAEAVASAITAAGGKAPPSRPTAPMRRRCSRRCARRSASSAIWIFW